MRKINYWKLLRFPLIIAILITALNIYNGQTAFREGATPREFLGAVITTTFSTLDVMLGMITIFSAVFAGFMTSREFSGRAFPAIFAGGFIGAVIYVLSAVHRLYSVFTIEAFKEFYYALPNVWLVIVVDFLIRVGVFALAGLIGGVGYRIIRK